MKKIYFVVLLAIAILICQKVSAQSWIPMPGGSLGGRVTAITTFGGYTWVGGNFSVAGPVACQNVVRHDGSQWLAIPGLSDSPYGFCVYNNELYALGCFDSAGVRYGLMKWSGSVWAPLGVINSFGVVYCAAVYNSELIVGGAFYDIDGIPATSLARWNGTSWNSFSGTTSCFWLWPPRVNGLHVARGSLYVAGAFDEIAGMNADCAAKWNGSNWRRLNISWNTYAVNFAHTLSDVYVVGNFFYAGPSTSPAVAKEGVSGWVNAGNGVKLAAFATATHQNKVYVAGTPTPTSGDAIGNCGYWNGVKWVPDNVGISGGFISALHVDTLTDNFYVGGSFNIENGDTANYIAYRPSSTLPVTLISFTAKPIESSIKISWSTASEVNADYFSVGVSRDGQIYTDIQIIPAHGTTTVEHVYSCTYQPNENGMYYFQLTQYDWDGVCRGAWEEAVRFSTESLLRFSTLEKSIQCDECEQYNIVVSIYAADGKLIDKKIPPIQVGHYSTGTYVAKRESDQIKQHDILRFFISP
jgi:hypothetical protein